jgi:hypothetical protein
MAAGSASRDTDPDAHRLHIELMSRAEGWRKLQLADQLNRTVRALALAGLRARHPGAPPELLRRLLADLLLGTELAERAYGPRPKTR